MRRLALVVACVLLGGCWDWDALGGLYDGGIGGGGADTPDASDDDGSLASDGSTSVDGGDGGHALDGATLVDGGTTVDAAGPIDLGPLPDLSSLPGSFVATASPTTTSLNGIWGSSASDVYIVGGVSAALVLHGSGNGSWTTQAVTAPGLNGVWGSSASNVYAVGQSGAILRSTGNGSWTVENSGVTDDLRSVWGSSASDVYAVGSGVVLHSTGNGLWSIVYSSADAYLLDVAGDGADVWVVGSWSTSTAGPYGLIVHKSGNGDFTEQMTSTVEILQAVWARNGQAVIVGGAVQVDSTSILRLGPSGWTTESTGAAGAKTLFSVWGSGLGDVYAVGHTGVAARSTVTGSWQMLGAGAAQLDLFRVWGSAPDDVWAVGENGAILHLH